MLKDKIYKWLDIPALPEPPKDWTDEFAGLEKRTWKYEQVLKERVATKCPVCKKKLYLWPMETEAYYSRDGEAYHTSCYGIVLKENE